MPHSKGFRFKSRKVTTKKSDSGFSKRLISLKKLSKNDTCVQLFSNDNFFPYFLKKPTCTKFYLSNQIVRSVSEKEFISELKQSLPNIILMKSPNKILLNYDNFPNAIKYVKNEYEFYENYKGYVFYIRKNLN